MDLTLQDVLLSKLDAEVNLLNFFITLVKLHIWISRNHGVTPNLSAFKDIVYYFLPGYCYWNKECKTLWPGTNHAKKSSGA